MLKQSVEGSEELNIDMLWEAMDWYRKGLIAAREKQVLSYTLYLYDPFIYKTLTRNSNTSFSRNMFNTFIKDLDWPNA